MNSTFTCYNIPQMKPATYMDCCPITVALFSTVQMCSYVPYRKLLKCVLVLGPLPPGPPLLPCNCILDHVAGYESVICKL